MNRSLPLCALLAVLSGTACIRAIPGLPNTTSAVTSPRELKPPDGMAAFVVFHGEGDRAHPVVFKADGTALCQMPSGMQCKVLLSPGRTRLYVTWMGPVRGVDTRTEAWDLDVVAGRTYFATVSPPRSGWSGTVNEKFTPTSKHWGNLDRYLQFPEVTLDAARRSELQAALGDVAEMVSHADARMAKYDARHLEAHSVHPDDGI